MTRTLTAILLAVIFTAIQLGLVYLIALGWTYAAFGTTTMNLWFIIFSLIGSILGNWFSTLRSCTD